MTPLFEQLQRALAQRPVKAFRWEGVELRPSAVLVPLFWKNQEPFVVLTRRPMTLRTHAGQMAFPGGSADEHDSSLLHTALREASEEIGLPSEKVEVLGRLDDIATPSMYRISAFVGALKEDVDWLLSSEVEEIISVPLRALLNPACLRLETRTLLGHTFDVHYYSYGPHTIWGATGRILNDLLTLIADLPSGKELLP